MDNQKQEPSAEQPFLIMTLILNEHQCHKFARIAKEKNIRGGLIILGKGTVKNATLNFLGIKSQKKAVLHILFEKEKAKEALDFFSKEFQFDLPGHGIAYTTPVITASQIINHKQGIWTAVQGMEAESMYNKLTVVVNRGTAEDVMDIARKSGVTGGTIMHGRGTGSEFTEKLLGVEIEPEKEIVMILMPSELTDKVVNTLFQELKLDIPGNGVLFVEPVVEVRGLFDSRRSRKDTP